MVADRAVSGSRVTAFERTKVANVLCCLLHRRLSICLGTRLQAKRGVRGRKAGDVVPELRNATNLIT